MANPDASQNDRQNDPQDDTTFDTNAGGPTADETTQLEQTVQTDQTEQLDTTDSTRAIGDDQPVTSAYPAGEQTAEPVLPPRPSGPHAPAIVLGLVCLAVAGIILAQELGDLTPDWGDIGPFGIIVTGAVLVLFGLVGLLTSRRTKST